MTAAASFRNKWRTAGDKAVALATVISDLLSSGRSMLACEILSVARHTIEELSIADIFSLLYQNYQCFERGTGGRWSLVGPMQIDGLYIWQKLALKAWSESDRRGIVEAVTGTGKTRIALEAARQHLATGGHVAIIVPTIDLMEQWAEEIRRYLRVPVGRCGGTYKSRIDLRPVTLFVAASVAKHLPDQLKRAPAVASKLLLIADECHHYGTDVIGPVLSEQFGATLGITATLERSYDDGVERYIIPGLGHVIYKYDYESAMRDKVIPKFELALVKVEFDDVEVGEYDRLTKRIGDAYTSLKSRYPGLDESPTFFKLLNEMAKDGDSAALAWLSSVQKRREVLIGAKERDQFVKWLAKQPVWDRRVILFHETIHDCEELASYLRSSGIAAQAHHSERDKAERKQLLNDFRSGKLQAIIAPRTLDEGVDVPDASLAVLIARTSVERQSIQRVGRVLRRSGRDTVPQAIVLCVRDARDDPDASGDEFVEELRRLELLSDVDWPMGARGLASWLNH